MQENSNTRGVSDNDPSEHSLISNPEEDGRNKEWQDRSRVNLEQTPEGTHTNIERDFEPENLEEGNKKTKKDTPPSY
jgi:hypothetical protein